MLSVADGNTRFDVWLSSLVLSYLILSQVLEYMRCLAFYTNSTSLSHFRLANP